VFGSTPFGGDAFSGDAPTAGIRISGPLRHQGGIPGGDAETGGRRGGRHGSDDVPVVTGVPVGRPTLPPASFDVFTPIRRSEQDGSGYAPEAGGPQAYPDFGNPAPESGYVGPYDDNSRGGSPYDGNSGRGSGNTSGNSLGNGAGNNGAAEGGFDGGGSAAGIDANGLPRRVRQASIAPELRAAAAANPAGSAGVPAATAASLTDMRNTLSAMQRGWQQGRSQTQRDTEGNQSDGD
jgi:hypothetical protein